MNIALCQYALKGTSSTLTMSFHMTPKEARNVLEIVALPVDGLQDESVLAVYKMLHNTATHKYDDRVYAQFRQLAVGFPDQFTIWSQTVLSKAGELLDISSTSNTTVSPQLLCNLAHKMGIELDIFVYDPTTDVYNLCTEEEADHVPRCMMMYRDGQYEKVIVRSADVYNDDLRAYLHDWC